MRDGGSRPAKVAPRGTTWHHVTPRTTRDTTEHVTTRDPTWGRHAALEHVAPIGGRQDLRRVHALHAHLDRRGGPAGRNDRSDHCRHAAAGCGRDDFGPSLSIYAGGKTTLTQMFMFWTSDTCKADTCNSALIESLEL